MLRSRRLFASVIVAAALAACSSDTTHLGAGGNGSGGSGVGAGSDGGGDPGTTVGPVSSSASVSSSSSTGGSAAETTTTTGTGTGGSATATGTGGAAASSGTGGAATSSSAVSGTGGSVTATTTASGTGGAASSAATTTTTTTATTSASGTGGAASSSSSSTGAGTGGFDGATTITVDDPKGVDGTLKPVDGGADYYEFQGTAGQWLDFSAYNQNVTSFDDKTVPSPAITLYDANKKRVAEAPPQGVFGAELDTHLAATGTYYVRIVDCTTWLEENPNPNFQCNPAAGVTDPTFTLFTSNLPSDASTPPLTPETEPNDTAAQANTLSFAKQTQSPSGYQDPFFWGTHTPVGDVDAYAITFPSDYEFNKENTGDRTYLTIGFLPSGDRADGSTAPPGKVTLALASAPTSPIASLDFSKIANGAIAVPVDATKEYVFFVPDGGTGANDFYLGQTEGYSPGKLETEPNDSALLANAITLQSFGDGVTYGEGLDGDLSSAGDVDTFRVSLPIGTTGTFAAEVECQGQTGGSGVRGLTVTLENALTSATIATGTESATDPADVQGSVPANATSILVKVTGSLDTSVSSKNYACGVYFLKQ